MFLQSLRQKADLNKIGSFRKLDGWLTDQEALGLFRMAAARKNAVIVEIGSWQGKSSFCLASGLSSGTLYAIDPLTEMRAALPAPDGGAGK